MVMAMLGYDVTDHKFWHAFLRVHTFVDLAAVFNRRQTDARARAILDHWNDSINFEVGGRQYSYGSHQNYIRLMMHPAGIDNNTGRPRSDNIYRWGNTNDTFATANATQRTIITLFPVPGERGTTSTWMYHIAEPGYDYNRIHNPDISVEEEMYQMVDKFCRFYLAFTLGSYQY
jgi:hypothetical protein